MGGKRGGGGAAANSLRVWEIRRAASGVSDRQYAAAMHSMHSAERARRTSPTGPRRSALEACKKHCFSLSSGGVRARTLKLPAPRTAAPGYVSWRRPITPPRKLQHFRPARGRLGWLPRAMDGRGPSNGGHRIGRPSNVAPLLGCATEGSWWGCHHCLDQQHCTSCAATDSSKE